ncbi:MAG: phosphonate C-P lyase system protein PhnH [Pseudomonadota bacterium]
MSQANTAFQGGFTSPVIEAQAHFHGIMRAMSRPGTVIPLEPTVQAPRPLNDVASAVALTLCDTDTPVYLDHNMRDDAVGQWLRFHTGAPVTEDKAAAQFAIMRGCEALNALECFAQGTRDYPDRSTTLIVQVDGFDVEPNWSLSGPGIDGTAQMSPTNAPASVVTSWTRNTTLFPRGIDVILTAPDALSALPRTINITLNGRV